MRKPIEGILNKKKISWHSIRVEELLREHQLKPKDAKKVWLEVLKLLSSTEKDIYSFRRIDKAHSKYT